MLPLAKALPAFWVLVFIELTPKACIIATATGSITAQPSRQYHWLLIKRQWCTQSTAPTLSGNFKVGADVKATNTTIGFTAASI